MKKILLLAIIILVSITNTKAQETIPTTEVTWNKYGYVVVDMPQEVELVSDNDSLVVFESPNIRITMQAISREYSEKYIGELLASTSIENGVHKGACDIQYLNHLNGLANGAVISGEITDNEGNPLYLANSMITMLGTRHYIYIQVVSKPEWAELTRQIATSYKIDLSKYNDPEATPEKLSTLGDGTIIFRDAYIALSRGVTTSFDMDAFIFNVRLMINCYQAVFAKSTIAFGEALVEPDVCFVDDNREYVCRINNLAYSSYAMAVYKINDNSLNSIPDYVYNCTIDTASVERRYIATGVDDNVSVTISSQAAPGENAATPIASFELQPAIAENEKISFQGHLTSWLKLIE